MYSTHAVLLHVWYYQKCSFFVIFCKYSSWVRVKTKSKLNFVRRGKHLCTLGFMHEYCTWSSLVYLWLVTMFWTPLVRTSIWVRKSFEEIFILKPCSWGRNHFIHPCLPYQFTWKCINWLAIILTKIWLSVEHAKQTNLWLPLDDPSWPLALQCVTDQNLVVSNSKQIDLWLTQDFIFFKVLPFRSVN